MNTKANKNLGDERKKVNLIDLVGKRKNGKNRKNIQIDCQVSRSVLPQQFSYLHLLKVLIFLQVKAAEVKESIRSCLSQSPDAIQYGEIVRAGELGGIVKGDGR